MAQQDAVPGPSLEEVEEVIKSRGLINPLDLITYSLSYVKGVEKYSWKRCMV
jgi:hypothetical protein